MPRPMRNAKRNRFAFTLIEVIGCLAVIAILASLLIPTIFEAINNARLGHVLVNCQTIKTAVIEHYAKFGTFASSNGTGFAVSGSSDQFDAILLAEGLIDKPFVTRLSTNVSIRLIDASLLTPDTPVNPSSHDGAYNLDADAIGKNDVVGRFVVEALLVDVMEADAKALNDRLDGPGMGEDGNGDDFLGRVIYRRIRNDGTLDVHIYLTHR